MRDEYCFREKLLFVMGLQRSGTTALAWALSQDDRVQVEHESAQGPLYEHFFLRPEPEIRSYLWRQRRRVLLKPISEIQRRSVADVLDEFISYGPRIAWIFRDPVDVWASSQQVLGTLESDFQDWLEFWINGNQSALTALSSDRGDRLTIVQYEELCRDPEVFTALCRRLGVAEVNNFFRRSRRHLRRRLLDPQRQRLIREKTASMLAQLRNHRLVGARSILTSSTDLTLHDRPWLFWRQPGCDALAEGLDDPHGFVRVTPTPSALATRASAQLCREPIEFHGDRAATILFWARAEAARTIGVCVGQRSAPYADVAPYQVLALDPDWRPIEIHVQPLENEPDARLLIELGGFTNWVELTAPVMNEEWRSVRQLEIHNGARAKITLGSKGPLSTAVQALEDSDQLTDVQLVTTLGTIERDRWYSVSFRIRSDQNRPARVSVGGARAPWSILGCCCELTSTTEWTTFSSEFLAEREEQARLYFDLGGPKGMIEIDQPFVKRTLGPLHDLHVVAPCRAHLSTAESSTVRVLIDHLGDQALAEDIQLQTGCQPMIAGRRYAVELRVRAAASRAIQVGVGFAHHPWTDVGLYEEVNVDEHWRRIHLEFVGTASDDNIWINIDLANASDWVEFERVELIEIDAELSDDDLRQLRAAIEACEDVGAAESRGAESSGYLESDADQK